MPIRRMVILFADDSYNYAQAILIQNDHDPDDVSVTFFLLRAKVRERRGCMDRRWRLRPAEPSDAMRSSANGKNTIVLWRCTCYTNQKST